MASTSTLYMLMKPSLIISDTNPQLNFAFLFFAVWCLSGLCNDTVAIPFSLVTCSPFDLILSFFGVLC